MGNQTTIILRLGSDDKKVEVTIPEAKKLYYVLDELFGSKLVPSFPTFPTVPDLGEGWNPIWCYTNGTMIPNNVGSNANIS